MGSQVVVKFTKLWNLLEGLQGPFKSWILPMLCLFFLNLNKLELPKPPSDFEGESFSLPPPLADSWLFSLSLARLGLRLPTPCPLKRALLFHDKLVHLLESTPCVPAGELSSPSKI